MSMLIYVLYFNVVLIFLDFYKYTSSGIRKRDSKKVSIFRLLPLSLATVIYFLAFLRHSSHSFAIFFLRSWL